MNHFFDTKTAEQYGVNAAIIYSNIKYWIAKNESENRHFHNGRYWTYMSKSGLSKLFPYMTVRQIDYALKKLENAGLIICGDFNNKKFDRTKWYALGDIVTDGECEEPEANEKSAKPDTENPEKPHSYAFNKIVQSSKQNCSIEQTKLCDRANNDVQSKDSIYNNIYITNNKPNNNPDNKGEDGETPLPDKPLETVISKINDKELRNELREFVRMRKKIRKPPTDHALELIIDKLKKMSEDRSIQLAILRQSITNCWQGLWELKSEPLSPKDTEMKPTSDVDELERRFMQDLNNGTQPIKQNKDRRKYYVN